MTSKVDSTTRVALFLVSGEGDPEATSLTKATANFTVWSQNVVGRIKEGDVCSSRWSAYARMRNKGTAWSEADSARTEDLVITVYALVSIESKCLEGRDFKCGIHCKRVAVLDRALANTESGEFVSDDSVEDATAVRLGNVV